MLGYKNEKYEFKLSQIELLSELRKNLIKSITLNLPVHQINETIVDQIDKMTQKNKGKALLRFNIYDPDNNMTIQMFSRTSRIEPTNELLNFFEKDLDLTFRIN